MRADKNPAAARIESAFKRGVVVANDAAFDEWKILQSGTAALKRDAAPVPTGLVVLQDAAADGRLRVIDVDTASVLPGLDAAVLDGESIHDRRVARVIVVEQEAAVLLRSAAIAGITSLNVDDAILG